MVGSPGAWLGRGDGPWRAVIGYPSIGADTQARHPGTWCGGCWAAGSNEGKASTAKAAKRIGVPVSTVKLRITPARSPKSTSHRPDNDPACLCSGTGPIFFQDFANEQAMHCRTVHRACDRL